MFFKPLKNIVLLTIFSFIFAYSCWASKSQQAHRANQQVRKHIYMQGGSSSTKKKSVKVRSNHIDLEHAISRIIKKCDPNVNIGIQVQSMEDGKIIYRLNADRLFMPASSLKIFTAVAALKHFGPDYRFKTLVLAKRESTFVKGIFNGDIYFYFDGDPVLKRSNLDDLVAVLQRIGIRKIKGDIRIDDSIFDQENYGPGWMRGEENFCYAAPTSAININKNCLPFKIIVGKDGGLAQISSNEENAFIRVVNSVQSKCDPVEDCTLRLRVSDENLYHMSGCVWPCSRVLNVSVALKNIRHYTAQVLADLFAQHNIKFNGEIKFSSSPLTESPDNCVGKDYFVLAAETSPPLSTLVRMMLKKSDNLIADVLFKKLGYSYLHKPGNWRNGAKALRRILANSAGMKFSNIRIVDGSGLSHYNLLSPASMSKLLNFAYHDKSIKDVFYAGLPISGIDGSLAYRLSMPGLIGKARAKTGTMKGITSLAGYLTTANDKSLSFVIIINDFTSNVRRYRQMEDAICALLFRQV